MLRKHLWPVLGGMVVLALVAGAVAWRLWSKADAAPLIDKALDVVVLAVIGALTTLLADALQTRHENETGERELRLDLLRRAVKAYAEAKKIRRQLRTDMTLKDAFGPLNDVQLEFESLKREAETTSVFVNKGIPAAFESMEKYLHEMIKLCEKPPAVASTYPFEAKGWEPFADFTGRYEGSSFEARFAHAFDGALALMQREILHRST
jgi:hypothetical protein